MRQRSILNYRRALGQPGLGRRAVQVAIALGILTSSAIVLWMLLPHGRAYYWYIQQRRITVATNSPGQIAFSTDAQLLDESAERGHYEKVNGYGLARFSPQLAGFEVWVYSNASKRFNLPDAFFGTLRRPDGVERFMVVYMQIVNYSTGDIVIWLTPEVTHPISFNRDMKIWSAGNDFAAIGGIGIHLREDESFQLFYGQRDAKVSGRVTYGYVFEGQTGEIEALLETNDTVQFLISGPLATRAVDLD